jgi:hypothetical protein
MPSGWDCCRACRRCWRFCAGGGTDPALWRALRWLLILAQIALLWQPVLWLVRRTAHGHRVALVVADIVALLWLLTNPRLRACFRQRMIKRHFLPMSHSNKR